MTNKDKIWPVIVRYLDNTMGQEDSDMLKKWLKASDENHKVLQALERIWRSTEKKSQEFLIDQLIEEEDWNKVVSRIRTVSIEKKRARIDHFRKLRKRKQFTSTLLKVAAFILVAFTSGYLTLKYAPVQSMEYAEPVFNEITTNPGERANIDLADGTKVTLNVASTLMIPEKFSSDKREIELTGQAFFEVKPDQRRPFYIHTDNAVVEVIGTSFDVRSIDDEDDILVAVRDGKVELRRVDDHENRLIVNGGYKGTVSRSNGRLAVELIDDPDLYFGWMEGRLIFQDSPITDVFKHIERWYDVTVEYDSSDASLMGKKFTADLKTRSVHEVFEILQLSMDIDFEIKDDLIRITSEN